MNRISKEKRNAVFVAPSPSQFPMEGITVTQFFSRIEYVIKFVAIKSGNNEKYAE